MKDVCHEPFLEGVEPHRRGALEEVELLPPRISLNCKIEVHQF
jgi:hypothetical protein